MQAVPDGVLRRSRAAGSTAFGCQGLLFAVLLTHLPAFKDGQRIGDAVVTLVVLGVTLLAGAGTAAAEGLTARRSSGAVLTGALLLEAVGALAVALAPGRGLFFAGFALYGAALGAVDATSNMQAVAVERRYGRSVLTSFHAWWSAAGIAGALWTALSERVDLPIGWSVGLPAVLVAALAVGAAPHLLATGAGPATGVVEPAADVPWRPVLLVGLAMAGSYVADSGTSSWSAVYLHDVLGAGTGLAALAYAGYQATAVLSRVAGDHAVRRWGAPAVVRTGATVGLAGLLVAVLATGPWLAVLGFTVVGLGLPVVAPLAFAAAGRLAPGAADVVVARLNLFNYLGALGGGVLVGGVGSAAGLRLGFVVPLVVTLGVLALAPAFAPREAVPAR